MKRTDTRLRLCITLLICNLIFIWGNSLVTGEDSGNLSGGILAWVNSFLGLEDAGAAVLHHLLRKAAHFTEFACLGALLAWYSLLREEKHNIALPALLGMAAGLVDETVQLFTPDRGPSLRDVGIDTCGVAAGMALLWLGYTMYKKRKKHSDARL